MSQELRKIERPLAEEFKAGRKLYFVPLIYCGKEPEAEYLGRFNEYWNQVEEQVANLELKWGRVDKIYYELIPVSGEDGVKAIKDLNDKSYEIIKNRIDKGAQLEAIEEAELLTEFMDWNKCLLVGKKRNEHIARQIDETLKTDEAGILFMAEGYQVQFPSNIQVFYIAPPALDEIKRWLRDREVKPSKESNSKADEKGGSQ